MMLVYQNVPISQSHLHEFIPTCQRGAFVVNVFVDEGWKEVLYIPPLEESSHLQKNTMLGVTNYRIFWGTLSAGKKKGILDMNISFQGG